MAMVCVSLIDVDNLTTSRSSTHRTNEIPFAREMLESLVTQENLTYILFFIQIDSELEIKYPSTYYLKHHFIKKYKP